jgi:hypothetical protein
MEGNRDEEELDDGGDSDVGEEVTSSGHIDADGRAGDASQPNRETRGQKNGRNVQWFEA